MTCSNCQYHNTYQTKTCSRCNAYLPTSSHGSKHVVQEGAVDISSKVVLRPGDELRLRHGFFEVVKLLGEGGFGIVYQIKNKVSVYALKLLKLWEISITEHKEMRSRFAREFQVGKTIKSRFIVENIGTGMIEGNPYFIMEFCSGGNLEDQKAAYTEENKLKSLAIKILSGLHTLHQGGIIHRDIKPENVIFDNRNMPKLTDFGISGYVNNRVTKPNWRGGSPQKYATISYLPPEQWLNEGFKTMGPVTDIFAFGVMMYEVLTNGQFPYGSIEEIMADERKYFKKLKAGQFTPIRHYRQGISEEWEFVIHKSISPKHTGRFQSVENILAYWNISTDQIEDHFSTSMNALTGNHGDWILQIKNGDAPGLQYNLEQILQLCPANSQLLTLGWKNEYQPNTNHVEIPEKHTAYISGRHATLEKGQGYWRIRDGQWYNKTGQHTWNLSTNGTWINSECIGLHGRILEHGDIITVGDTTLKIIQL